MAFFNLWSSERLSFSLSIVAVISATITSYFQFFHTKTDVKVIFSSHSYQVNDTTGEGILRLSGIFMNDGTSPVSLLESSSFFSIDTTWNHGKMNGWESQFIEDYKLCIPSSPIQKKDGIYVGPHSTTIFDLEWTYRHSEILDLVERSRRNGRYSSWNSSLVQIDIGMYAGLVTSKAQYSGKRMYAITQWFDVSDTLNPRKSHSGRQHAFFNFHDWEVLEEHWEPIDNSEDPSE